MKIKPAQTLKMHCNHCKQSTKHSVLSAHSATYNQRTNPEMQIDFAEGTWEILQCLGCETVSFREQWITSEDRDFETGEMTPTITRYPETNERTIGIKTFLNVPSHLSRLYREVVDAYNQRLYTLAAAGLRATIEGICTHKNIRKGPVNCSTPSGSIVKQKSSLEGKIEGLRSKGFISKLHAEALHQHRFLGNEALHELERPSGDELRLSIEIMEHTLENVYEMSDKLEELKLRKSRRRQRQKRSGP